MCLWWYPLKDRGEGLRKLIGRLETKPFYRDLAVMALFVVLLVAFFWKVFFLGRALVPADLLTHLTPWSYYSEYGQGVQNPLLSDPVRFYYPRRFYFLESLRRGVFPLWNPYVFSGIPFAANIQNAIFYPFKILFMPLPLPIGYTYETILHVFLAGLFTYWFLRSIHTGRFGSLLASIAFMFSSIVVVWLEFAPVLNTMVWLPLILLLAERALQRNSSPTPYWQGWPSASSSSLVSHTSLTKFSWPLPPISHFDSSIFWPEGQEEKVSLSPWAW